MDPNDDPYIYNGFPMNTPMDIRLGLTQEDGIKHKLRWGIISASSISSDWVKSLQDVPGARFAAIAARDMDRVPGPSPTPTRFPPPMTPTKPSAKTPTWTSSTSRPRPGTTTGT